MKTFESLGRSTIIGNMQPGEVGIFFDKVSGRHGLACCIEHTDSSASEARAIFAHAFNGSRRLLIDISIPNWQSIDIWALPNSAVPFVDFESQTTSHALNLDDTWDVLFLNEDGNLVLPVYSTKLGSGEHSGWLSLTNFTMRKGPQLYQSNFQCFQRWGLGLKDGFHTELVWENS